MARKEINFTLDTMRQDNTSIGTFKQLDDIVLNLTITENGVVKDLTSQDLKIYIAKADKTIIEQREGIEVTGAEEGTVKIELLNAATQVNGITVGELNISDEEGTISTVNFYYNVIPTIANDTVIESTNVIGILKELEKVLAQAKEDLKGLNEFQTQVKVDEQIRQSNEELRVKNEESREIFEEGRKKSENSRRSSESIRNKSEKERESAEEDRKSTESQRETAELGRKTFEEKRVSAEVIRQEKEETRQQEEEKRVQTEILRAQAEDKRASGEETRVEAEKVRLSQEAERVTAENERTINEIEREQSEEQRVSAESGRVIAESSRARAEEERTASESQRITDETKRAESENKRVSDEAQRVKDEKVRVGNEEKRVLGESDRTKNETARVEAEKVREEQFNKLTDAKTLIDNSKIDENKTWSSKHIIDHLLQENEWKPYDNAPELIDATNGYIKGLEIEGNTVKSGDSVQGVGLKTEKGYKIGIKTHGKNLIDISKLDGVEKSDGGYTTTKLYRQADPIKIKSKIDTRYTINIDNKNYISIEINGSLMPGTKHTFTSNSEEISIKIGTTGSGNIGQGKFKKLQLEEGTQATKYEPYKESTSEIILQDQLQGIGDIKDRLYYDEGYKVEKKIKTLKVTSVLQWAKSYGASKKGVVTSYITPITDALKDSIISNINTKHSWNEFKEGVYLSTAYNNLYVTLAGDKTLEELKEWLNSNNVVVNYCTKTPTTTDTQIKTELLPQTYKNKTYIDKDMGVSGAIKGEYAIDDFKKKIDDILLSHGLIQAPHTTLEELEKDEPTTLEEFQDEPTTLEEL